MKADLRQILSRFGGRVPATMEELLTLPGVGRKTANLVLILRSRARRTSASTRTCTASPTGSGGCGRARRRRPSRRSTAATARALVAVHQPVSRDLGPERLPAGVPALPGVRDSPILSAGRRDHGWEGGERDDEPSELPHAIVCVRRCSAPARWRGAAVRRAGAPGPVDRRRDVEGHVRVRDVSEEAPKTVAHIVELVKRGFYDGQRFHRALAGSSSRWAIRGRAT